MSERKEWLPSELAQAEDLAVSMAKQIQELTAQRDALLAACEGAMGLLSCMDAPEVEAVRAAIAKARGGER